MCVVRCLQGPKHSVRDPMHTHVAKEVRSPSVFHGILIPEPFIQTPHTAADPLKDGKTLDWLRRAFNTVRTPLTTSDGPSDGSVE